MDPEPFWISQPLNLTVLSIGDFFPPVMNPQAPCRNTERAPRPGCWWGSLVLSSPSRGSQLKPSPPRVMNSTARNETGITVLWPQPGVFERKATCRCQSCRTPTSSCPAASLLAWDVLRPVSKDQCQVAYSPSVQGRFCAQVLNSTQVFVYPEASRRMT